MTEASDTGASGSDAEALKKENARLRAQDARLKKEVKDLKAGGAEARAANRLKRRGIVSAILVILACVSLVATTLGAWVNRTVWNPDRYIATVAPIVRDPAVTDLLATRITDQVFQALDVETRIQEALVALSENTAIPSQVSLLAGPLANSTKDLIRGEVAKFLQSEEFQQAWVTVNERMHPKIVALLQGDYSQLPNISVDGASVQLNLVPVVAEVIRNLAQSGLGSLDINITIPELPAGDTEAAIRALSLAVGEPLPADFGQVTILTAEQLDRYQEVANGLHSFELLLAGLSVAAIFAAIAVSPRRRRTVAWLGAGTAIALVLGAIMLRALRRSLQDAIESAAAERAASSIFDVLGNSLRRAFWTVGIIALLVALVAYLVGRPPWMRDAIAWGKRVFASTAGGSEAERWFAQNADAARIGGGVVAVVLLFWLGIGWVSVLLLSAVYGSLIWFVSHAEKRVSATTSRSKA